MRNDLMNIEDLEDLHDPPEGDRMTELEKLNFYLHGIMKDSGRGFRFIMESNGHCRVEPFDGLTPPEIFANIYEVYEDIIEKIVPPNSPR